MGASVRTGRELILSFARDAVQLAQQLRGQAHGARSFGRMLGQSGIDIDSMSHADMAQVFNAADHEHVAIPRHDRLRCTVQCRHGRAAEAIDGLSGYLMRDDRQQRHHPGNVDALLECLVDAAPEHIFHFCRVELGIARKQAVYQRRRHVVRASVAETTVLGSPHRGTCKIYNYGISRIQAHLVTPACS
jgi:hypothetical protein